MKKALITGITGQDGSYLAEILLAKGYEVHGVKRRSSSFNTDRVNHLYRASVAEPEKTRFKLHYGDLSDSANCVRLVQEIQPDEIYNLGAMSHVKVSFDMPEYTANIDGLGTLRLLEAIRLLGLGDKTRFYQASTSELFGKVQEIPQKETTPFYPRSPYACAKLYAYWICVNYREAYGMYACNGILFNHESPRRGETFVTRKITRGLARSLYGLHKTTSLGNLDAKRDWGHAREYAQIQWLMLQQEKPEDFVIATGRQASIRAFAALAGAALGLALEFEGEGLSEKGRLAGIDREHLREKYNLAPEEIKLKEGDCVIDVNPRYFRPTEVETLLGDPAKAREKLGYAPKIALEDLASEMVAEDLRLARREAILASHGEGR